jgi:hypothetical protein
VRSREARRASLLIALVAATLACRRGPPDRERQEPIAKLHEDRAPRKDAPAIRRLFAGGEVTCVLDAAGEVRCAGENEHGRLGDPVKVERPVPTRVDRARGADLLSIARFSSCMRLADGAVDCFGVVAERLGVPRRERAFPPRGADLRGVLSIAVGDDDACALLGGSEGGGGASAGSGEVWCWGRNLFGEVGDGALGVRAIPSHVVGLREIDEIAVGHGHACARLHGGFVRCWGRNDHGQLGDGTTIDRRAPVDARLAGATRLALGESFTCVAMVDGVVRCFGDDEEGALGDGAKTSRAVPAPVAGLTGAVEIVAGEKHACARRFDGAVWCWGGGEFGQLGDGARVNRSEARPIGLTADELVSGNLHTCARKGSHVWCWGANTRGQLGDGTTVDRARPVEVPW